jgi:N-acetylmuramic acid 6-phosphate etherase
MIRLGKVFDNLMVDVVAGNDKLRARARRIVRTVTGAGAEEADEALAASGGSAKVAIVSLLTGLDAAEARSRLEAAGGDVRPALEGARAG